MSITTSSNAAAQLEVVVDSRCVIGEGPLWHPMEERLYWVDIQGCKILRYDPASGAHESFDSGDSVGGFTIQRDGSLLLFMTRGRIQTWRDGKFLKLVGEFPKDCPTRFNDVIADPDGRVFCGTMPLANDWSGGLFRLDQDGKFTRLLTGVGIPNGMGFSRDLRQMYFTDFEAREIYLFDYDRKAGAISNKRLFVRVPEGQGNPDGMTVDTEDHVWSARWDGGCVVRYSPDGIEKDRISFPARKISSVTFGGGDHTQMYFTTAGGDRRETEGNGAGALFRTRAAIGGVPEFQSAVLTTC